MSKYMNWELYDKPPEGFSIDKHTGSPLTGYDFYTNGKSVLNGGVRILVKAMNVHVNNITDNHHPVKKSIPNSKEPKQVNPEKPDVPLNKNDAFQKVQKRRVQEKR